jgi:hypothetical protein
MASPPPPDDAGVNAQFPFTHESALIASSTRVGIIEPHHGQRRTEYRFLTTVRRTPRVDDLTEPAKGLFAGTHQSPGSLRVLVA